MKTAQRKLASAAFATLASIGLIVGTAPAASSQPVTTAAGQAYFWTGTNYTGSQYVYNQFNGCRNTVAGVRSSTNSTGFAIEVYSGQNCTGTRSFAGSANHGFAGRSIYSCSVCRPAD